MKVPDGLAGELSLPWFFEKVFSGLITARGRHYLLSWLHRITGFALVAALLLQLAWVLGVVPRIDPPLWRVLRFGGGVLLGFHGLNGLRLTLGELFDQAYEGLFLPWLWRLSLACGAVLAAVLPLELPVLFAMLLWGAVVAAGYAAGMVVEEKAGPGWHLLSWKLQRITGVFLLVVVPFYLLFPPEAILPTGGYGELAVILKAIIYRIAAVSAAATALYHAGYGLFSVIADYVPGRWPRTAVAGVLIVLTSLLAVLLGRFIVSR